MAKKSNEQWLRDQLDFICELGNRVGAICPEVSHDYGPHTALKLSALNHGLGIFLPIARKYVDEYRAFDSAVYIDLFAGCGATRVPQTGDWLAGSPVLAAGSKWPFDRLVCIEKNPSNARALLARLARFPDRRSLVLCGDCNVLARNLKTELGVRNPLAFVFVDPQGMEIQWSTLEALSRQFPCMDLLFNFTYGAERVLADLRRGGISHERIMTAFAGPDWPQLLLDTDLNVVDFVEGKISSVLGKPVGDKVQIRDLENRPRYFLLLRLRRTGSGTAFYEGYRAMLVRVANLSPKQVLGVLNDRFGRSISSF